MFRVFIMAFAMGLFGLMIGAPLAGGTKLFRGLGEQGANFAVLLFFLTGAVIGAIAGATDTIAQAINRQRP